jgi:PAS domain S-box-containing protein
VSVAMGFSNGSFDPLLLILSVCIAVLSSYASLDRISSSRDKKRKFLLMGILTIGIWSTQTIIMLSYESNTNIKFSLLFTVFSLIFSIFLTFVSFSFFKKYNRSFIQLLAGSIALAVSMVGANILGMLAMDLNRQLDKDSFMMIESLFIVLFTTFFSFFVFVYMKMEIFFRKFIGAAILGAGLFLLNFIQIYLVIEKGYSQSSPQSLIPIMHLSVEFSKGVMAYGLVLINFLFISFIIFFAYLDKAKAEKLHKISEQHYKSLAEYTPSLVFSINLNGKITSINPKVLEKLNYQSEDLLGSSILELFSNEDRQYIVDSIFECQIGKPSGLEVKMKTLDQSFIPMSLTFIPIIIDQHIDSLFIVGKDITSLLEYQERIKKSQLDLIETVRKQQGMTFKYVKINNKLIHTLCDGELLYRLGLAPNKVIGKTLFEFLPNDIASVKNKIYEKAWKGQKVSYEGKLNDVYYLAQLTPIIVDGKVKEVIGSSVDITDKKKAERSLEKEKEFYRNILNTMSEAVLTYGINDEKMTYNKSLLKIIGMEEEEFIVQKPGKTSIRLIEENGVSTPEAYPITYTLTTGNPLLNKVLGIEKNQEEITWFSVNTRLLEIDGNDEDKDKGVLLTMSDITQQKNHELALKEINALRTTILDNLHVGILVIDDSCKIRLLNQRFRTMFHIQTPFKEIVGKSVDIYVPLFFKDSEEIDQVKKIIEQRQPITIERHTIDNRFFIWKYAPFYVDQDLKGHLWTFEDITDRKALELENIKTKETAIKASLAKSKFLSKMSHELRTPLNGILGFSQILEMEQTLSPQQQSFVQHILKGGRHLLNLINEILDLAKIEAGEMKISQEYIQVRNIIVECINMLQPVADQKNIYIDLHINLQHYMYVYCDPLRLRQIILNLLDNAIKYNHVNGKVLITCEEQHGQIMVEIQDTGIGITPEEHVKIFESFYRVNQINVEGTGIGLSIVKQLVYLMNGKIGIKSNKEGGSTFWFSLPSTTNPCDERDERENLEADPFKDKKNSKILYIEDNAANVHLMKQIIGGLRNIVLITAATGEEGLELIQEEDFDLILLDLNLPGMNGSEVLYILKSNLEISHIPVIAVSANAMEEDILHAKLIGFSDYITKPFHISTFLQLIAKYL